MGDQIGNLIPFGRFYCEYNKVPGSQQRAMLVIVGWGSY